MEEHPSKSPGDIRHDRPKRHLLTRSRLVIIVIGFVVVFLAAIGTIIWINYLHTKSAAKDASIEQAISQHHVDLLLAPENRKTRLAPRVKDTRVIGIKDCTTPDNQADTSPLQTKPFAYILDYDSTHNGQPTCQLSQIMAQFGRPNASVLIAGTLDHPTENLLFYDHGIHKVSTSTGTTIYNTDPATVVPIPLSSLKTDPCSKTSLTIVAHQDDDLLFINPDAERDIQSGACVRTIYLTAGDGGNNSFYWLGREHGSEQAYTYMTPEPDNLWIQRIIKLGDSQFIHIDTPKANPKISLIFFRLPDGNLQGRGFPATKNESLARLHAGTIKAMHAVDGQSIFTDTQLRAALVSLMEYYHPDVVRSQSTQLSIKNNPYLDHSDHVASGAYAEDAFHYFSEQQHSKLYLYHGYPIHAMSANLTDSEAKTKTEIFLQYAQSDTSVCQTAELCKTTPTYGSYLQRMYQAPY